MKKTWTTAVAALCMTAAAVACAPANTFAGTGKVGTSKVNHFPVTLKDDAGQKVTVSTKPLRIASVTEGTDEILSALVPKHDIVLVTALASDPTYSNVAKWAKGIQSIQSANAEGVISVHPDLALLSSYNKPGVVKQIEQAGIPTYEFGNFNTISDIENNIRVVGKLTGETTKANQVVDKLNQQIKAVKGAVKGQKKLTVLDYSSYGSVAGKDTTVNDVIVDAGGKNAAVSLNSWATVTPEQVVKMNPDVIIDTSDDVKFVKSLEKDPKFQTVNAVKNHRIYVVPAADLGSVSQYIIKGVKDVAHDLYPTVKLPK